ncbi:MAG: exopolysaccharide transport family protein [Rhizobiaceae bacterium]|nr:exopolysaccharide transport family protein [Rhizobiaceae bacterium]
MNQVHTDDTNVDIDLGSLFSAVKRNAIKIILAVLIAGVLAFFLVNLLDEKYRSEARILIDNREPIYTDQQQIGGNLQSPILDERGVTSQMEILKSNDLVMEVARQLDLASYPEFDTPKKASAIESILIGIGLISNPFDIPAEERILKEFYERLDVYQIAASRVIVIEFSSEDPKLAALVPNAMADAFLRVQSGEKLKDNNVASAWLEPEIERLREGVRQAEAKVAEYRAEKGLLLVGDTDTLNSQQLSDISAELTRVRSERVDADARATTVRRVLESGQDIEAIANVLDSTTVQRLRETEGDVRGQIADLSTTLLEGHPRMQALRAQLIDIQRQLRGEARKVLASLENEASVARLRERELQASLNSIKANSAQAGGEEVQLRALEREANSQRQLLETYLSRFRESASRANVSAVPPDARIISRAIEPTEAYFPKKLPIIIVAMFATFILSAIWVMLAELFSGRALRSAAPSYRHDPSLDTDDKIAASGADVPEYIHAKNGENLAEKAPLAASLISEDIPANRHEGDAIGYSIDQVISELAIARTKFVVCLSPEGDTAVAGSVMLARKLAGLGLRPVLLDLTLNGGPSGVTIGTSRITGITNLLCGETTIADTLHPDRQSNAHVMARGNGNIQRAMRAVDRIPMIVEALGQSYDTVVVECGPSSVESAMRLIGDRTPEYIISVKHLDEQDLYEFQQEFIDYGFPEVITMDLNQGSIEPFHHDPHDESSVA